MKKINPESFMSKVYLLVIDKLIIGAMIAIVFVIYDQYKSKEEYKRSVESQQIQLDFERTKLAKEFWPLIMDKNINILTRGYSLRSALLTKAIDPETGVDVSYSLLKAGLPTQDFIRITKSCMPGGLLSLLKNAEALSKEQLEIEIPGTGNSAASLKEPKSGERLDSALNRISNYQKAFREVISSSIQGLGADSFNILNDRKFLSENIFSLFYVFQAHDSWDAIQQSKNNLHGLRIVGMLNRIFQSDIDDMDACNELNHELEIKYDNSQNINYASSIISILSQFRIYTLSGNIAIPIARIAVDTCFKYSKETRENEELFSEHRSLQWEAAEFLIVSMDKTGAIKGEPILITFLKDFINEIESSNDKESLNKLSGVYTPIPLIVETVASFKTKESMDILKKLSFIYENKHSYFPLLREETNRAINK